VRLKYIEYMAWTPTRAKMNYKRVELSSAGQKKGSRNWAIEPGALATIFSGSKLQIHRVTPNTRLRPTFACWAVLAYNSTAWQLLSPKAAKRQKTFYGRGEF